MAHYILQTIAFQLFFLIIYDAFLMKETFFNWNRAYLLFTAVLSIALPFIQIQSFKNVVPRDFVMAIPEVTLGNISEVDPTLATETVVAEASKFQFSWELLFFIGAFVALAMFMFKLIKIVALIYRNPKQWNQNLRIVTLLKSNTAFSFFYYVFLGEHIKEEDKPTILKHEAVHVNQKHTFDLLLFELMRIVFWFNPLVYMYQSRISSLHEFIADAEAVKTRNKNEYYQDLLSQIFETENVSFINAFYKKSLIKKRIVMLSRAKSKQKQLIKYALLIPLVFGMLLYTSSYAQDHKIVDNVGENKTAHELSDEELQEKFYDEIVKMHNNKTFYQSYNEYMKMNEGYLITKEQHYRFQSYMKFVMNEKNKSSFNDKAKNSLLDKVNRTYSEYLEWKKTDEAKEHWENNTSDGNLRLLVKNLGSLTDEEQKRQKDLIQLMIRDDYFHSLTVSDGLGFSKFKIEDYQPKTAKKDKGKVKETQDPIEVPFATIEEIPMLPACNNTGTLDERRDCVASEISKHVQKNFNQKLAWNLGLTGKQLISVVFKIDTNGNVFGVRSRAPHPDLEAEAIRVIKTLPQFTPGKQNGEKVIVPYALPIVFEINDGSKTNNNAPIEKINVLNQVEKQDGSDLTEVPFAVIGEVPVYPGCENIADQKEQRKCMSSKITEFVQKKFNTDLAKQKELTGRQRINVIFKIDTLGNITGIRSRAAHPDLENEAERVIGLLPNMQPGKHKGKKVIVPYSLPIIFQVGTSQSSENKKKPSDLKSFKIVVETEDNKIKLKCESGCAWKELTFISNDNNKIQAINQLGTTQLNKDNISKDSDLANFLITLEKTEKGIKLKGIEGTAWTDLSFSLPIGQKQIINELGMINE